MNAISFVSFQTTGSIPDTTLKAVIAKVRNELKQPKMI